MSPSDNFLGPARRADGSLKDTSEMEWSYDKDETLPFPAPESTVDKQVTAPTVHFSHPILGTYEVIQFFELANLEGTPFQCGIWAPYQYHDTMGWKSHTISLPFQYHVTSYHTIGIIEAFQFQSKPYHHSKAVTGCLGSFFQNMKNISAGCNTGPLGSIFCGHALQIFTDI